MTTSDLAIEAAGLARDFGGVWSGRGHRGPRLRQPGREGRWNPPGAKTKPDPLPVGGASFLRAGRGLTARLLHTARLATAGPTRSRHAPRPVSRRRAGRRRSRARDAPHGLARSWFARPWRAPLRSDCARGGCVPLCRHGSPSGGRGRSGSEDPLGPACRRPSLLRRPRRRCRDGEDAGTAVHRHAG